MRQSMPPICHDKYTMPALTFISDDQLEMIVKDLLDSAADAKRRAEKKFDRNVIDPFAILFETGGFKIGDAEWLKAEQIRQAQKSLQNHVGLFHQKVLGAMPGWQDLGASGGMVDLVNVAQRRVAEVKNKHNTLNAASQLALYKQMEQKVMPKGEQYKGFTAYCVEIIPAKGKRYNQPYTPSDRGTGSKCHSNELIRQIDGYSFYALASGVPDALEQLFLALPDVIEAASRKIASTKDSPFVFADRDFAKAFFTKAFG